MSRRALLAWLWTIAVLIFCWIPGSYLPEEEHGPKRGPDLHIDKATHAGMFAIWGFLWMGAAASSHTAVRVSLAGLALAIITELGQEIPIMDRDASLFDGIADLIGLGIGIGVEVQVRRSQEKKAVLPAPQEP